MMKVFIMAKSKIFLYIALLMSVLACGATLPTQIEAKTSTAVITFHDSKITSMVVRVDEALNIRDGANGQETGEYKHDGDVVKIYHRETVNKTLWCAINPNLTRWVACRYLAAE